MPHPATNKASWTRVQPFGPDAYTYWFSGIYKIVSYRKGEYLAFYIVDGALNWGDHVAPPPDAGKYGSCWGTLKVAKAACALHAETHTPKPATVRRAAEVTAAAITKAHEYAEAE